ncbi:MAG: hypoxanthine phosphoribosyltransferase [Pirellulales bacterium]
MNVLLTEADLRRGVERLASEVKAFYGDAPLTIIGVLTGSLVLVADLIRLLDLPLRIGFVQARSYRGATTVAGTLAIRGEMLPEMRGQHVLLVDDIFDTGRTLQELLVHLAPLQPATVRSAVLLRKQGRQEVDFVPDHVVFEIPDKFVVGYGLDYDDLYRQLPYVATLDEPAQETVP